MNKQVTRLPQVPKQIQVNMAEATAKKCECGSEYFTEVHKIIVLSALAKSNPTGKDIPAQLKFSQCIYCKTIWTPNKMKIK